MFRERITLQGLVLVVSVSVFCFETRIRIGYHNDVYIIKINVILGKKNTDFTKFGTI